MKILESEPEHVDALIGLGNCYINQNDIEKAVEFYNKIEFEKIKDQTVLYNVGTIFYNNSKFGEALKYYKKAVEIQEDFCDAIYQLGLAYLANGNNPEALIEFENYLKYDTDSPRAEQVKGFIDYLKKQ
jgi:Tfp pilus assembly protein PilF